MGGRQDIARRPRSATSDAARQVVAVARLGEADLAGWWRSHGLDDVGEYLLPDLFPRTAVIADAELALLSAAKRHTDALPDRTTSYTSSASPRVRRCACLAGRAEDGR